MLRAASTVARRTTLSSKRYVFISLWCMNEQDDRMKIRMTWWGELNKIKNRIWNADERGMLRTHYVALVLKIMDYGWMDQCCVVVLLRCVALRCVVLCCVVCMIECFHARIYPCIRWCSAIHGMPWHYTTIRESSVSLMFIYVTFRIS